MRTELRAVTPDFHWPLTATHQHFVQIYESDAFLLDTLADFVSSTLDRNEASIVVATDEHLDGLKSRLNSLGIDLAGSIRQGQFVLLEAASTMDQFMVNGMPDVESFQSVFGTRIGEATRNWPAVRVFGEMVALTADADDRDATIELERCWNELQKIYPFTLCCAYPLGVFNKVDSDTLLQDVCDQHSEVFPTESYVSLPSDEARMQAVAVLQQKASRLEQEAAQRQQVEERLRVALAAERSARKEAETALRMRDEFVSIAAHELKTPLTSLLGHSQLMLRTIKLDRPLDPKHVETVLKSVTKQAHRLARLVTQLLDISRLEAGKLPLERQPVDLAALVRESVESALARAEQHKIEVSAPESLIADVDPLRLEQVVANLLSNAIRYSPGGGEIQVTLSSPDPDMVELSIRDYGLGIPKEKRDRIFERYYQAHQHESRSGMGLGLYISKQIIELHRGEIRVEFPSGGGTCVIVGLPVNQTSALTVLH